MSNVQKSFNTMGLTAVLKHVTESVIAAEKVAKSTKEIQTMHVLRPGLRQDIFIGSLMVIPYSVMEDVTKIPLPLLKGATVNLFCGEEASALESHRLAETEFDELEAKDFNNFKDKLFRDTDGKLGCLCVFLPAWANPRDYSGFRFVKDAEKLEQLIRHNIFTAYFRPSLSALFDTLEENQMKLDVVNIQHEHMGGFADLLSETNVYPVLEGVTSKTASARKPFIRFAASELDAIKEELLSPEEKAVMDQLTDAIVSKVSKKADFPEQDGPLEVPETPQSIDEEEDVVEGPPSMQDEDMVARIAADAEMAVSDNYLASDEDSMGLIEDMDSEAYETALQIAIYEAMEKNQVPFHEAEALAEQVKDYINGRYSSSEELDEEPTPDMDLTSALDNFYDGSIDSQGIEGKTSQFSGADARPHLEKVSMMDFFAKCEKCGALTSVPSAENPEGHHSVVCESCSKGGPKEKASSKTAEKAPEYFDVEREDMELPVAKTAEKAPEYFDVEREDMELPVVKLGGLRDPSVGRRSLRPVQGQLKKALSYMAPGQVLKEFYPGVLDQVLLHPAYNNSPIGPDIPLPSSKHQLNEAPNSESDHGFTTPEHNDNEADEKHSLTSPGLVSTESGGGTPLRSQERNIRGPFFMDQFYKIHADISPASLTIKSSLNKFASEINAQAVVKDYLAKMAAEIASSLLAAFSVTGVPAFVGVPTDGVIDLASTGTVLAMNPLLTSGAMNPIITQLKNLLDSLSDSQLTECINDAYAQSAVWRESDSNSFVYEVFVRVESVDTEAMTISYKFVTGLKEK